MDARIKRLFSRKSSSHLKGYSYDSAISSHLPISGPFSLDTDGQYDIVHRGILAAAPDIPRNRTWDTNLASNRTQSLRYPSTAVAEESNVSKLSGRTFSGFSMKTPPSFRKRHRTTSSTIRSVEAFQPDATVPPIPQFIPQHSRSQSAHVDLILAASLKHHGSGSRDYGEDVADRNMKVHSKKVHSRKVHSSQSSGSDFNLDSPEFSYMRSIYSREKSLAVRNKSREKPRVSSAAENVLKEVQESSTYGDVGMVTRISSHGRLRTKRTPSQKEYLQKDQYAKSNSIFVSTTHETTVTTYQPTGKPTPIPSLPYEPNKLPMPARSKARSLSIASNTGRGRSLTRKETIKYNSNVGEPVFRTIDDFIMKAPAQGRSADIRQTASPSSKSGGSSTVATAAATGKENTRSESEASTPPLAVSTPALETENKHPTTQQRPTTPANKIQTTHPMSPETFQPPARTPIVTPKKDSNSPTNPSSANRSRDNSCTYSPFPRTGARSPPVSREASQMSSSTLDSFTSNEHGIGAKFNNPQARAGPIRGGASEAPSLRDSIDLNGSVDTKVSTRSLPAVTNETITPQIHNIREEQVTREIHTHDVYHRIQPVIDVEVLPTKHYIRNSTGGLTEISASAVPARPEDWQIEENSPRTSSTSLSSDSVAPPTIQTKHTNSTSNRKHATSVSNQPVVTSTRTSTMLSGKLHTESKGRQPPSLEASHQNQARSQATPASQIMINRHDGASDRYDDDESESSQSRRSEDSAFLFRDTGYGGGEAGYGGGMLPGLFELTPTAQTVESQSTKALRRKMGGMSSR